MSAADQEESAICRGATEYRPYAHFPYRSNYHTENIFKLAGLLLGHWVWHCRFALVRRSPYSRWLSVPCSLHELKYLPAAQAGWQRVQGRTLV